LKHKVLVVGGGGREHALAWKLSRSEHVGQIVCAPGNAGTVRLGRNVPVAVSQLDAVAELAARERPDLVVVGPEEPLVRGLGDRLRAQSMLVFGPGAAAARLEGSKAFAKEFLSRHRIPTAQWRRFDRSGAAKSYLEGCPHWPQVVKADGLAAGKGVVVAQSAREACAAVDAFMEEKKLGEAGTSVVIEEFLAGEELSVLALTDGEALLVLEPVMDHKQVGEGDTGPNTGGMGGYSPVPSLHKRLMRQIEQHVLLPTLDGLRREELEYRGVLFVGLMLTDSGPKVLEYNCRFGDPETQVCLRRLRSDLFPYLEAVARGKLAELEGPDWDSRVCVGVVGAAEGYPGSVRKGDPIDGLEQASAVPEVVLFHAGTKPAPITARDPHGEGVLTDGGRVFCATALGETVEQARERAYAAVDLVRFDGRFCRRDIGLPRPRRVPEPQDETAASSLGEGDRHGSDRSAGEGGAAARSPASFPPRRRGSPSGQAPRRGDPQDG
jgi:phosphoribosylamine--glycine ligase